MAAMYLSVRKASPSAPEKLQLITRPSLSTVSRSLARIFLSEELPARRVPLGFRWAGSAVIQLRRISTVLPEMILYSIFFRILSHLTGLSS